MVRLYPLTLYSINLHKEKGGGADSYTLNTRLDDYFKMSKKQPEFQDFKKYTKYQEA